MKNYSVIIPFRDKFELLKKAVSSIPDRNDIQIILVYNGVDEFKDSELPDRRQSEILILSSSPSKGAGHARNIGLDNAIGQYILFLDSDDFFTEQAFGAFDKYLNKKNDITFFKPTSVNLKNGLCSNRHIEYTRKIDEYLETGNEEKLRYRWEGPVCKMYRNDFLRHNNFRFDEIQVSNDAWFSLMTGHNASVIGVEDTIVYVITEGESGQSLVKTVTPETIFIRFDVAIRINKFLKDVQKSHLRIRLLGFINKARKEFGLSEAWRFFLYALHCKANVF